MELSRRSLIKAGIVIGALTAASTSMAGAFFSGNKKPNVLFIAVDDLNDWIGALGGHPQAKTPNIDRLFRRSTAFTDAHAPVPVCGPSRTCILTGMRASTTGLYHNEELGIKPFEPVAEKVLNGSPVLPEHFKNNGYYTMATGKISHHGTADFRNGDQWDEEGPKYIIGARDAHIFANGYGYGSYGTNDHKYYPFPVGGGQVIQSEEYGPKTPGFSLSGGPLERRDIPNGGVMPDEFFADWTVERLKQKYDKPFFLACGFIRPHVPYAAPKEYFDMFPLEDVIVPQTVEKDMSDVPLYGKALALGIIPGGDASAVDKLGIQRELVQAYLACVTFMDDQLGKILNALDASPYADNTAIMFWGDHGQHLGEHKSYRKFTLWNESTRVPLFVSTPGQKSSRVCKESVNLLDMYPTLVDMCHLPQVKTNEGLSLMPLIINPKADRKEPTLTTYGYKCHAIRDESFTYIRYRDGGEELYDRINDPDEHKNLVDNPEYQSVKVEMAKWLPKDNALPYGVKNFDKEGDFITKILGKFEKNGIPEYLM